jgi:Uma2 family endonuclease
MKGEIDQGELQRMSSPIVYERPDGPASSLPSLQPGDHLDQKTFHQLYEAMPEGFKAELVGGIVFIPFALSTDHGDFHSLVVGWLFAYRAATPGTRTLDNSTIILGPSSEPQPDAVLLIRPEFGGQTRAEGRYTAGPPELVVEVAYSSHAYDLHSKLADYESAGVKEYLVLELQEQRVAWFVRQEDQFQPLAPGPDGWYRSTVFPGLWLDSAALFAGDAAGLLRALHQGMASPEHAAFAAELENRKKG